MESTRLLLVRHGKADPQGRFLQHACTGLTPVGVEQAHALGRHLAAASDMHIGAVLASRAARSIQTAEIVATYLGVAVAERTCDLCEMHPGEAEGLTPEEMQQRWGPTYGDVPGAEWFPDWTERARASLERIAASYRGQTVVCVTHNGMIRASMEVLGRRGSSADPWRAPGNTGVTEWLRPDGHVAHAGGWRLVRHDDLAHLQPG